MSAAFENPIWTNYLAHRDVALLREDILTCCWETSREAHEDSLLMVAVHARDPAAVVAMISAGESVHRKATDGFSYLHSAVDLISELRGEAQRNDALEILGALLANGADPNVQGMDGTPLHRAAGWGCVDAMKLLLQHGADIEARMLVDGEPTPLLHAALLRKQEAIDFLIEAAPTELRKWRPTTDMSLTLRSSWRGCEEKISEDCRAVAASGKSGGNVVRRQTPPSR